MSVSGADLQQLMADTAADAMTYAAEEFSTNLDNTEASIALIDELILRVRDKYGDKVHDSKVIFTLCNMFGAYLGEIFRAQYGGTWVYDDTDPNAPSVFLQHGDYTFAFAGIVYQRLINDQNLSARLYYDEAVANAITKQ